MISLCWPILLTARYLHSVKAKVRRFVMLLLWIKNTKAFSILVFQTLNPHFIVVFTTIRCWVFFQKMGYRKSAASSGALLSTTNDIETCKYCGKTYRSKMGLWYHVREHEGKFSYTCNYCGKGYNAKSNYNYHVSMHEGRGYGCLKCKKVFRVDSQLKKHQRSCCN